MDDMGGDIGCALAVQHPDARQMRLRAPAPSSAMSSSMRESLAPKLANGRDSAHRAASVIATSSTMHGFAGARGARRTCSSWASASSTISKPTLRTINGRPTSSSRVSDAPSSSTSKARTWPLPVKSSVSGAHSRALRHAEATPPAASASDAALTTLRLQRAVDGPSPSAGRIGLQPDRTFPRRPAARPAAIGRYPRQSRSRPARASRSEYFHSSIRRSGRLRMQQAAAAALRSRSGQRHAASFTICS